MQAAPSPADVVNPASQSRDMYRMLHENVAQMRGSFKGATVSPEEVALRDATALLEDLRQVGYLAGTSTTGDLCCCVCGCCMVCFLLAVVACKKRCAALRTSG